LDEISLCVPICSFQLQVSKSTLDTHPRLILPWTLLLQKRVGWEKPPLADLIQLLLFLSPGSAQLIDGRRHAATSILRIIFQKIIGLEW
jgi:hypothetical protein